DREIICERKRSVERGTAAAVGGLDRLRGLARCPQAVGEAGVLAELDFGSRLLLGRIGEWAVFPRQMLFGGDRHVRLVSDPQRRELWLVLRIGLDHRNFD